MIGLNKTTGESITRIDDHVRQSINDIITTPIGSRVMRRNYGSVIPDLIDQPLNQKTLLRLYAATAAAVMNWEPRFKISGIEFSAGENASATVDIKGSIGDQYTTFSVHVLSQTIRTALSINQRFIRNFNGTNQATTLPYSAGDEIILDVYPINGNTGLPGGCPAVVNTVVERITFVATDSGVIGSNGADYFEGYLFRCEINGTVYPLADEYRVLRDASGQKAAEWINEPTAIILTQDTDTGDWQDMARNTTYALSDLMAAINIYGAENLAYSAEKLHTAVHSYF